MPRVANFFGDSRPRLRVWFSILSSSLRIFLGPRGRRKLFWVLANLKLTGATHVGTTKSGNALVCLNRDGNLGQRGTLLELPIDNVIFEEVRLRGKWSADVSKFLVGDFENNNEVDLRVCVIDIGANSGLVSLQAMKLSTKSAHYFLFEPLARHLEALRRNVEPWKGLNNINILPFALGSETGDAKIYSELSNFGNSSFVEMAVPLSDRVESSVKVIDTHDFFEDFGKDFDIFSIKCDTQGMDAVILSRVPPEIWSRTTRAVVEVWALPDVDAHDVDTLLEMWGHFDYASWDANGGGTVTLRDVRAFWLSGSSAEKNLFLAQQNS